MRPPTPAARRLAMVSEHASPLAALGGADAGGQNVYVARLAEQLARDGHEVTVYTRRDDPALPPVVTTGAGVRVAHVDAGPAASVPKDELLPHIPAFAARLHHDFLRRPPDLVHTHFWMSGLAAVAATRTLGVPVVHTYHALGTVKRRHQGAADTSPAPRVAIETTVGRLAHRLLATCADEVRELRAMGLPADRIAVVPCGVDTEHFAPRPAGTGRPGRPPTLLAVGRLVPRKGFDRAIRALRELPEVRLLIAGGPPADRLGAEPEAVRLRKIAAECGVTDRFTLLGGVRHAEMPALLSRADLVLSLPVYEPFGIVPIEAMACGTPVVATAVGGQLDTVLDGVTGAHVPATAAHTGPGGDPYLVRALRELLADPVRLPRLGAAGRRRALGTYTWDRVAAGVHEVYESALRQPTPVPEAAR
ncbi:glycosyltransferase [Streptomyces sp. NPDC001255]|uniref:glycosyltransferase n=1 Tax=Streptomyces sp. NPDC001255 TaxID=3364550 RepID=UPI0036AEF3E5